MPERTVQSTPIRRALKADSDLQPRVGNGINAIKKADRRSLASSIRRIFGDSLDLDAAMATKYPSDNRWDYLLGQTPSGQVVALELHSAKADEVSTVIMKRKAAIEQLAEHLRPGERISRWLWVAPGKNHFADTEKARRWLDENGIEFVGARVLAKHLTD